MTKLCDIPLSVVKRMCFYLHRRAIRVSNGLVASSPGPSQILSHSHGEKSGEGLGSKICHDRNREVHLVCVSIYSTALIANVPNNTEGGILQLNTFQVTANVHTTMH